MVAMTAMSKADLVIIELACGGDLQGCTVGEVDATDLSDGTPLRSIFVLSKRYGFTVPKSGRA